jgi:hypothetical protein
LFFVASFVYVAPLHTAIKIYFSYYLWMLLKQRRSPRGRAHGLSHMALSNHSKSKTLLFSQLRFQMFWGFFLPSLPL